MLRNKFLLIVLVLSLILGGCAAPAATPAASEAPAAGEAPAAAGKTVLNVWSFTNEIMTMAIAFEKLNPEVDVQYTMIPMTNGDYQTKLLAALGTADAPDVIALEASFVKQYVEADFLADLSTLLSQLSPILTQSYFTHVHVPHQLLASVSTPLVSIPGADTVAQSQTQTGQSQSQTNGRRV